MDWASFLIGLLPTVAVGAVCLLAFLRRRRSGSPLIVNPYTMVVAPMAETAGRLPVVQPMPPVTTSQPYRVPTPDQFADLARQVEQRETARRPRSAAGRHSG